MERRKNIQNPRRRQRGKAAQEMNLEKFKKKRKNID